MADLVERPEARKRAREGRWFESSHPDRFPPLYFMYILQSRTTGRFYVGHCGEDLIERFRRHQFGQNLATKNRGPWWMPYYEIFHSRAEAMQRERAVKAKKSAASIRRMIKRYEDDLHSEKHPSYADE